jgi:pimeloyl-ACP methyl ester carboxylesterase
MPGEGGSDMAARHMTGRVRHGSTGRLWLCWGAAVFVLTGCVTFPNVPTTHIVMANGRGNPVDPTGNVDCRDKPDSCQDSRSESRHVWVPPVEYRQMDRGAQGAGLPAHSPGSYEVYLKALFEDLVKNAPTKNNKKQILIFIHGGLNTQVGTVERAVDLLRAIPQAEYYPIVINWQSSLFSSYFDHLLYIRQGKSWDRLVVLTTPLFVPVYFAADVARAVTRAPIVWYFEVQNWVKSVGEPETIVEADAIAQELEQDYRTDPSGDALKMAHDPADRRGRWDAALAYTTAFLTAPTKLVSSMFIDAFGKSAWEVMLRLTHLLYHTEREFFQSRKVAVDERKPERPTSHIKSDGALSVFLRGLQVVLSRNGGVDAWEITLVGHSMGTIVLNQMVREFGVNTAPGSDGTSPPAEVVLPFNRIVYMAGAATVRDYQDSLFPYLRRNQAAQVYHLILHPRAELRERFDPGIPRLDFPPRGSLLVWVDDFLSAPETPLDRTVGRYENLLPTVHNMPNELRRRVHIKSFGNGRDGRTPQKHGDFTAHLKFWKPECWWSPGADYPSGCYGE